MTAALAHEPSAGREPSTSAAGPGPHRISGGLLEPRQLLASLPGAVRKLGPRTLWRNPVMFIVEIGAIFTTVLAVTDPSVFAWSITVWLWLTVVFANLAEAVAEGRGKAQADTLRRAKKDTVARRLPGWSPGTTAREALGRVETVPASQLRQGDVVVVEAGEIIPGDGDVVEGIASVDLPSRQATSDSASAMTSDGKA